MKKTALPASVSAIIYNRRIELLMFTKPDSGVWRCLSGWVGNETLTGAMAREITEETRSMRFRITETMDAHSCRHRGTRLISVWYLVLYLEGKLSRPTTCGVIRSDGYPNMNLRNSKYRSPPSRKSSEKPSGRSVFLKPVAILAK